MTGWLHGIGTLPRRIDRLIVAGLALVMAACNPQITIETVETKNATGGAVSVAYSGIVPSLQFTTSDNGCSFTGATYNGIPVPVTSTGDSHVATLDPNTVKIGCTNDILRVRCASSAADDYDDAILQVTGAPAGSCPVCGNGVWETGEVCDDHNTVSCDGCSSNCTVIEPLTCGDGIVCPPEQCDGGYCNADCTFHRCGDGTIDILEACDDGDATHCGACNGTCDGVGIGLAVCGDGVVCGESWGETCDENEANAPDECTGNCNGTCNGPANLCGDGIVRCGEECDDGNAVGADGCGATCQDEPRLLYIEPTILSTDLSKQVVSEGDGLFTNDRSVDLFWANAVVDAGVFTSLELVVTALTPCAPPFVVEIPMIQAGSGSPQWTVDLTRQGRSLPLCGGLNFIVFYMRDENGAVSNGFDPPVQIDSAWAEILLVLPNLEARVPGSTDLYLTRDDFAISGYTNLNSLDLRIRRNEGPDILLTPNMPDLYGPVIVGGDNHGLYQFTQIPVDGAGHDTLVGFERHGSAPFEVLEQEYTLDPDILLVPVDAWIVLAPNEVVGTPGNLGADISVGRAQASFDPEFDPALPVLPRMGDPSITGGTDDWMIDRVWAQANIQFHVIDRAANIHPVNTTRNDLAMNPFGWTNPAICTACGTCDPNTDPAPQGGGPCSDCSVSNNVWECRFCAPAGNENCSNCPGINCTDLGDVFLTHCCEFGYHGQVCPAGQSCQPGGTMIEADGQVFDVGDCCNSLNAYASCGNTLLEGRRDRCTDAGFDVGVVVGRQPGSMNIYYTASRVETGDTGGHGDWLPLANRAGVNLAEGVAERRHVTAHEIGHYMGLSHVCARESAASTYGSPRCCTITPILTCSRDKGPCTTTAATEGAPPYHKLFSFPNLDLCQFFGVGVCIIDEPCGTPADTGCSSNAGTARMVMNQVTCEGIRNAFSAGVEIDQGSYYEISIARQALLRSGVFDPANAILELNP